ncbi:MAG: hypothetical protein K5644_09605 [Lachnospiraceae bacterium]|nr:hypothetical protein [Lachnospiraceae bacterium]
MKRTIMKRKVLAVALSLAMVMTCALSLSTTVFAGTQTYSDTGIYNSSTGTASQELTNPNTVNFDVQAKTTGGGDIVYSVKVDWGAMKFEYDYGSTWDPSTHTYATGSSGKQGGGWNVDAYVDGTNNKITITNDSNFPVKADFSYANDPTNVFNADDTTATAVKGMFNEDNDTLANTVTTNTANTQSITNPTMHLNTYKDNLAIGTRYYYYTNNPTGEYVDDMYFSLIGVPDRGLGLTAMQKVGSITVTITPEDVVSSATIPQP